MTGADDSVTGADDSVTGADDSVTGADDGVTGADDSVTGADVGVTGADDGVTGADDGVTGADDGVTGTDDSVTGADDGVNGADDGVTGADGLAVDVVDVHVVGVLHSFLADLLQKGVAGNDFVKSLYFSSQHLHFFHTCSSFSLPRKCLYVLVSSRLRVPALVEIFRYCQECFRCCNC